MVVLRVVILWWWLFVWVRLRRIWVLISGVWILLLFVVVYLGVRLVVVVLLLLLLVGIGSVLVRGVVVGLLGWVGIVFVGRRVFVFGYSWR